MLALCGVHIPLRRRAGASAAVRLLGLESVSSGGAHTVSSDSGGGTGSSSSSSGSGTGTGRPISIVSVTDGSDASVDSTQED